jgi:transmembrane sensor
VKDQPDTQGGDPCLEAADWVLRVSGRTPTASARRDFSDWLVRDVRHGAAADSVSRTWSALGQLATDPVIEVERNRARAVRLVPPRRRPARTSRWLTTGLVASLCVAPVAALVPLPATVTETAQGQRARISLPGGAVVELNVATRILRGGSWVRPTLTVERGEAHLDTRGAAWRVPRLAVGDLQFTLSPDTRIVVRTLAGRTDIAAATQIASLSIGDTDLQLTPGQRMGVGKYGIRLVPDRFGATKAWRDDRIVFENATVAEAIGEFQRYAPVVIDVAPEVSGFRVSGTFGTSDSHSFAKALSHVHPVTISQTPAAMRIEAKLD